MRLNKLTLHRYLNRIKRVKTWELLVVLIVMLLVSATLLRLNNLGMIEKREVVIQADKKLDDAASQKALVDLQRYVSGHMNTSLNKGVYRENAYNRDRDAALEAAGNASNPNSAAYQQASIECRARFRGGTESFRNDYVQCVLERVGQMSQGQDPASALHLPKADLYRYDFVSPLWTADAAGFAVLFTLLIALIIAFRLAVLGSVYLLLKTRHKHNYS